LYTAAPSAAPTEPAAASAIATKIDRVMGGPFDLA
jgi:hypothetical protein